MTCRCIIINMRNVKRRLDMTFFRHGLQVSLKKSLVCFVVMSLLAVPVLAAPAKTTPIAAAATPDPSVNPALSNMLKAGAKLHYLGTRSALDGWLIVKDGRIQIVYSTADKKSVIVGAMFSDSGENITSEQIRTVVEGNKELAATLMGITQEQPTPTQTSVAPTLPAPASVTVVSPGERLYQDLSAATGVTLGTGTPKLLMIMDPDCPHCQATWRVLRDAVFKNTIQLRMIPIATAGSDNERAAAQLLHTADPLNAWDKYVGATKGQGDKNQLAGPADPVLVAALRANHTLVDSWHIDQTPYLVYRGKDGKVKVVIGEPEKVSSILSDLVP